MMRNWDANGHPGSRHGRLWLFHHSALMTLQGMASAPLRFGVLAKAARRHSNNPVRHVAGARVTSSSGSCPLDGIHFSDLGPEVLP